MTYASNVGRGKIQYHYAYDRFIYSFPTTSQTIQVFRMKDLKKSFLPTLDYVQSGGVMLV